MNSYIKGVMQAGIWKQDSEQNIWANKGWEWEVEKLRNEEINILYRSLNIGLLRVIKLEI